jgi:hypothetical protein
MTAERDPKAFAGPFELDYYRRARKLRRLKWWLSVVAFVVSLVAVTALAARPSWHTAFQAAPVSHVHLQFGVDCAACHDRPFATAKRIIPGLQATSVSDGKCLACHDAGRHNPHQLRDTGENGQAANCVDCHREHRGPRLNQFTDATCTSCHADLKRTDGPARFATPIHHFGTDHPEFGRWRGQPLSDPAGGKFQFNHQRHLELAKEYQNVSTPGREAIAKEFARLRELSCVYCHQTDPDDRRMMPVRYENHCAVCHPINVTVVPPGSLPPELAAAFAREPLPHPAPGESAGKIRAELIERYLRDEFQPPPAVAAPAIDPPILRNTTDPKALMERERLAKERARETERQLFDQKGVGCMLCHAATGSVDGLPTIADPRQQQTRWSDQVKSWGIERLQHPYYKDAAQRWFPLSTFDHGRHRMMACTDCHLQAATSQLTSDVLMPTKAQCLACHHQGRDSSRSDCLTCHQYHDRSQHRPIRLETPDAVNRSLKHVAGGQK